MSIEQNEDSKYIHIVSSPSYKVESPPGSYEAFAMRPNIRDIDRKTVSYADPALRVIDIATGTGVMSELYYDEGFLLPGGHILGVDIDADGIALAQQKYATYPFEFRQGSAEELPAANDSYDQAIFANAIHLTDVPLSLAEMHRILAPGGKFVVNSAYVEGLAYPEGTRRHWGTLVGLAKRLLEERNIQPKQLETNGKSKNLLTFTVEDYIEMAKKTGFDNVEAEILPVYMDEGDVAAISSYYGFAEGALPGYDVEHSSQALVDATAQLFKNYREKKGTELKIRRDWMIMVGQKV